MCGYYVIVCDPLESRRKFAFESGIKNILPKVPLDAPNIAGHVALVLECSGHEQAVLDGCTVVQKGGEVVFVGVPLTRQTDTSCSDVQ